MFSFDVVVSRSFNVVKLVGINTFNVVNLLVGGH